MESEKLMASGKLYDESNPQSILKYAQKLEGKTINEAIQEQLRSMPVFETSHDASSIDTSTEDLHQPYGDNRFREETNGKLKPYRGKGSFGNVLEELYFHKKNDNISQPDFPKAGVELKTSPLIKKGKIQVKERLVLNHFKYEDIDKESFETSRFKMKNSLLLLVFYFYQKGTDPREERVDLVDYWECIKEDEAQIKRDWETIVKKVHEGRAEDISEGDTLYLGASTKGENKEKSLQKQPHSAKLAPGRALCFKLSYINHIYQILNGRKTRKKEPRFLSGEETFEGRIRKLVSPYIGCDANWIVAKLGLTIKPSAKNRFARIARNILGYSSQNDEFYEFKAASIQVKTIRVEKDGNVKESMSFKPIVYTEIVTQDWEDSDLYQELTSKFIFFIFRRKSSGNDYYLEKVMFWNMPQADLEEVHQKVWEPTKKAIKDNRFDIFPAIKDHVHAHVRTHGKNNKDMMSTPSGGKATKRSFWLNSSYIKSIISSCP